MKERPIPLYSYEVKNILEQNQPQIRRVMKQQPSLPNYLGIDRGRLYADEQFHIFSNLTAKAAFKLNHCGMWNHIKCPYGKVGDLLWVQETFGYDEGISKYLRRYKENPWMGEPCPQGSIYHRADEKDLSIFPSGYWKRSIYMPRWASRINLKITKIHAKRDPKKGPTIPWVWAIDCDHQ